MKYRASNNNNSTDAGMFHRDIHIFTDDKIVNIYTCLLYLDDSYMQLIPKSHKEPHMTLCEAISMFKKRKLIKMKSGSILIFHSSMIHRGIFYKKQAHRRLIQQFDCVDKVEYPKIGHRILHTPCMNQCKVKQANFIENLNKIKKLSNIVNYIVYMNVSHGYSYNFNFTKKINKPNVLCISTETNQDRMVPRKGVWEPNNRYITNPELTLHDIDEKHLRSFIFYSHYLHTIILLLMIILIIIVVVCIIYNLAKNRKAIIKKKKYRKQKLILPKKKRKYQK